MNDRRYNKLTPYIHEVSSRLALKEDDIKLANEHFTKIVNEHLIPAMKNEDEYFNKMFRKVHYTGSFYENLRINEPNEFDLNLELKSGSKNEKFFQIHCDRTPPAYVQIQHKSGDISGKWVTENGFVSQQKVFSWLQSIVDKALNKIRLYSSCRRPARRASIGPGSGCRPFPASARPHSRAGRTERRAARTFPQIWRKTSGPAVTLYVEYVDGKIFSVDLVPVFVFDSSQWLEPPVRKPVVNKEHALEWCVVPKPYNNNNNNSEYGNSETFWRISFYTQEKEYLNNKNSLKNALKITKLLRDEQGWYCLSSYYLKTMYLWALMQNEENMWRTGIGIIFMNMLYLLKDNLKIKHAIPFFWDERHNLLSSVNKAEIEKIGNRIENIIGHINKNIDNPEGLQKLFDTYFRGGNANQRLQIVDVTDRDDLEDLQLVPRPIARQPANVFPWFQQSPEDDSDQSLATGQAQSFDWTTLALGIGALALGGALVYKSTTGNRDK